MTEANQDCPLRTQSADLLLDYSAGRLDAAARAALERHMNFCQNCAVFGTDQASVWQALDLWEPMPVSQDFNRNLWRRIDAAAAIPWYRSLAQSLGFANWKPVLPLTAAIALIAAGFLLDHRGTPRPDGGFTLNEARQVEQTLEDIQLLGLFDQATSAGVTVEKSPKTM